MSKPDIIIIGTGSGGLSVGLSMHELGFKVLFIDKSEKFIGGECLNTGCVPSKALIHISKIIRQSKEAEKYGFIRSGQTDFEKVKAYIRQKQESIRAHENADFFRKKGIDIVIGTARFISDKSIEVNGEIYSAKHIILATGSSPRKLKVPGVEYVDYYDNENIFDLEKLPSKLLIVGAGPIGMELALAFQRLGSEVSVINNKSNILQKDAPEISAILSSRLEQEGIKFYNNSSLTSFENATTAIIENKDKGKEKVNFNIVLAAIGREIHLDALNLEKGNVKVKEGKLLVDEYLRTTNQRVYVAGDAAGSMQFSHAAELHATVIINNLLSPFKKKLNYDHFSWVTFTDPEVATFGLSEEDLQERKIGFEKLIYDFKEEDRAVVDGYEYGKMVLYLKKSFFPSQNQKILGGSIVAPNAGSMIQELILTNSNKLGIKTLFDKTYPYPVSERANKMAVVQKYTQELKPFVKKMLKLLY